MKKLVLSLVAVAAFGFTANAQETEKPTYGFQESNVFVEGMFSINNNTTKPEGGSKTKTTTYNFTPKVGYMLSDKFAVGVELGFGKNGSEEGAFGDMLKASRKGYVKETYAGAFGRYYFLELGQRFKTYAEVGVGFHEGVTATGTAAKSVDLKQTGVKAGLGLGMNYFVTSNLAISFHLGDIFTYSNYNAKLDGKKQGTVSNTDANVNIFNNFFTEAKFGLTYKF
ncbi:outer membrane beta-barrel protein [Myroides marinus]|uniref:outer membrane beta-barrel protein n=1 Tax=Myroides marinus TaxID=703342 RepID=UPI002576019B|nr:outer membrane beta-barrel protein [Myroides marinus]MDM1368575.1 outer membrane beta-barrel protein [Myroides marinus]MDM1377187.1 outer membrane beta-barrel protein [Myroides marinus]MDM1381773.1 outer membrane beta-barrel protein [Myroides marinus]